MPIYRLFEHKLSMRACSSLALRDDLVQVAQLAGIPKSITSLAQEKGLELEEKLKVRPQQLICKILFLHGLYIACLLKFHSI